MPERDPSKGLVVRSQSLPMASEPRHGGRLARVKRAAGTVFGLGVTLVSGMGILGAVIDSARDPLATTVVGCTLLTAFGTAGALLARRMMRQQAAVEAAPDLTDAIRARLFAVASLHRGRLTVAELAATLAVAPEPAEKALETAARSGEARLLFSPEGVAVYEFPGLLAAKSEAKEPWQL